MPDRIRSCDNLSAFKASLKTYLSKETYYSSRFYRFHVLLIDVLLKCCEAPREELDKWYTNVHIIIIIVFITIVIIIIIERCVNFILNLLKGLKRMTLRSGPIHPAGAEF